LTFSGMSYIGTQAYNFSGMVFVVSGADFRIGAYDVRGDYQGEQTARVFIHEFRVETDPIKELELVKEDLETNLRAEKLLKEVLGEGRYKAFALTGSCGIESKKYPGRTYVIREYGRVEVIEDGRTIDELCLVPKNQALIAQDVVALKKLMLEGNETEFLKIANHFPRAREESVSEARRSWRRRLGWR
jgi:hypothetical protein